MTDPQPAISLIVIAFNEHRGIERCIRAVLDQEVDAPFELIVVDDGSTDGTSEIARQAAAGDPRFRLVRLDPNQGRGAARQAGVVTARGSAVGFVDADITLPPDWLERCLAALPGNAAVGGIAVPDGDATVVARISGATPRPVGGSAEITGNNVLFDRAVLAQTGFNPRDRLGEDFRLANRLRRAGLRLQRVPGLTVHHDESKSYGRALRWRFENGIDAASHPREIGRLRLADLVWLSWLGSVAVSVIAAVSVDPRWLVVAAGVSVAPGLLHATTRFRPSPLGPFLIACLLDLPLLIAYLVGRTVAIKRFVLGRPGA